MVTVDHLAPRRRVARAVGGFAMYFGITIVSVFVPAAHVSFWSRSFLITSFVVLGLRLGQRSMAALSGGESP